MFFGQQLRVTLPHRPRLVFENGTPEAIDHLIVEDSSSKADLGRVPPGAAIALPIEPRGGERYVIGHHAFPGDELIRQLDFARRERRDVRIRAYENGEGFRYVSIEGEMWPGNP